MIARAFTAALMAAALIVGSAQPAGAQVVGTFSWQTQPYCNVITVTVIQQGSAFQLIGSDDQCGAAASPVTGTAIFSGGSVSMGLTVALANGRSAHLSTNISLGTLSGTWTDTDGNTGSFIFNGNGSGAARPAPSTVRTDTYFAQSVVWEQPTLVAHTLTNECLYNTNTNGIYVWVPIRMPVGSRLLSVDVAVIDGVGPTSYTVNVRKATITSLGTTFQNLFFSPTLGSGNGLVHTVYTPATPEISTAQTNYYVRVGSFQNSANGFCSVSVTYDPRP